MNTLISGEFITLLLMGLVSIAILIGFCISIANNYVKRNRTRLFELSHPLSRQCGDLGERLATHSDTFYRYIKEMGLNQTYSCSSSVVSNAENNVVKYLVKYSNIENDMCCMEKLDFCIDFMTTSNSFRSKMKQLSEKIKEHLPLFIRIFASTNHVPYLVCNINSGFDKLKCPVFRFSYVSPAGKSCRECPIEITSGLLRSVQSEISMKLDKSGHAKAQRSAMTNDLREAIKKRDNYTCCTCGNSVLIEPNLLLEVDHIIPVAKGGKTEASNLQTLCWRCNRAKSDKFKL